MSVQPRVAKVLAALLVSMTAGAAILMLLGNDTPSAGAFSLSSYCHLDSVDDALACRVSSPPDRWNRVEIYYSRTRAGNISQLVSLKGLSSGDELNCHFVVCNGLGGKDGQIQTTERWGRQWSAVPGRGGWYGEDRTIRVCVIADGKNARCVTDCQLRRLGALTEQLCRRFEITPQSIQMPAAWQ